MLRYFGKEEKKLLFLGNEHREGREEDTLNGKRNWDCENKGSFFPRLLMLDQLHHEGVHFFYRRLFDVFV